jgi:membrane protease YdiL (CAAX protease family)
MTLWIASGSALGAMALGTSPVACVSWIGISGLASVLLSVGVGLCLGAATIAGSRVIVRRAQWARAICVALMPSLSGAAEAALVTAALGSAVAEELLFRGLLVPVLGIVGSSIVFGAVHQLRGEGRWMWMVWATVMGLLFGLVFAATGSLAGAIVAHATINLANSRFLRDLSLEAPVRPLGGLLRR